MIFLAVTLGFFVQGLRKHLGDKTKEKEYIGSLVKDLEDDTAQFNYHKLYFNKPHCLNTFFPDKKSNKKIKTNPIVLPLCSLLI